MVLERKLEEQVFFSTSGWWYRGPARTNSKRFLDVLSQSSQNITHGEASFV